MLRSLPRVACLAAIAAATVLPGFAHTAQPLAGEQPDPFEWLEDVSSPRALAWVKAENDRTARVLEADPRFPALRATALKVLESPDRLAAPVFRKGAIYNTWQDPVHVRGILRRTTLADYLTAQPHWQTVIDYDALARADHETWVHKGLTCLYPGDRLCMVALSAGGEDATTLREFDLKTGKFVPGGFVLPRSKQSVDWVDKDTLLVSRDWGPGTASMTSSGYPFIIKEWKRGQPLAQAREVFRGKPSDVRALPGVLHDAQGHTALLFERAVSFFEDEVSLATPSGNKRLALPPKQDLTDLLQGQLILTLNQDWRPEGATQTFAQGSILSLDLAEVQRDPVHLKPAVVFAPTAQEFAQTLATTRNHLLLTTLDHVQGRAYLYTRAGAGAWTRTPLDVPDNQSIDILTTNTSDDRFFLVLLGFLSPSSYRLGDAATGELKVVKTLPPQFDAASDVVEQLSATSKDGTRVPYFVIHRKDMPYDGSNPTIMHAYGGFQLSSTPYYDAILGKLWLERGGVFVLANIRGGGEFGPAWHDAGLKTHRQVIYDDFAAVAEDLTARRITSPRRLGMIGGSNGGLLMGVEMTQHPELWHAVDIEVPLLDMLRFEQIAAGASWVAEYGSASVPEERRFLASISPYNQLRADVTYPEPLIFTTTKDDRVGPVHARKFAARLEALHKPFLYQEILEGGHGVGADLEQTARTEAIEYVYFMRQLMD
ncbi:MAG TPA: prolyl oligopeptidase family serine peptidase [Acidobacteriaceae bacterium]